MRRSFLLLAAVVALLAASFSVPTGIASATSPHAGATDCSVGPSDLSFASPLLTGSVPQGGGCFTLPLQAGDVVRLAGIAASEPGGAPSIVNADGSTVCSAANQGSTSDCTMPDSGPFVLVVSGPRDPQSDRVGFEDQVVRLNAPDGCSALPLAGFATDVPASGHVTEDGYVAQCSLGHVGAGGLAVLVSNTAFAWELRDEQGALLCSSTAGATCDLPSAGDVTLVDTPMVHVSGATDDEVVVPLASSAGDGCGAITADWTSTPLTVRDQTDLRVACQQVTTAGASRLLAQTDPPADSQDPDSAQVISMLVDASGREVCPTVDPTQIGCDVTGAGPVRVVSWFDPDRDFTVGSYHVAVRDVGSTVGCPTLSPTAWGVAAAATTAAPCRSITPTASARYYVDGTDQTPVFTPQGALVCTGGTFCNLAAGQTYLLTFPELDLSTLLSTHRLDGDGCSSLAASPASAIAGTAADATDPCAELPYPEGAQILPLGQQGRVDGGTVYDANGAAICATALPWSSSPAPCTLSGPAPYRVVITSEDNPYQLAFDRTDQPSGCGTLTAGAYGTSAGTDGSFSGTTFAQCLVVSDAAAVGPAIYAFDETSGSGYATAQLFGTGGHCDFDGYQETVCDPTGASGPVVLLLINSAPGTYRAVERPVGGDVSCPTIPESSLHGAALTESVTGFTDMDCYTLDAAPSDDFAVGVEASGPRPVAEVFGGSGPSGGARCGALGEDLCEVSGSDRYQVVVHDLGYSSAGPVPASNYQLSPFRYRTASGFAPDCARQQDGYAGGFGPLTGSLTAGHSVVCEVVPEGPGPYLVALGADYSSLFLTPLPSTPVTDADRTCDTDYEAAGQFRCSGFGADPEDEGVLLLTRQDTSAATPYALTAICDPNGSADCTPDPVAVLTTPSVTGSRAVGGTLTGALGTYLPATGASSVSYQWLLDGSSISGAPAYSSTPPTLAVTKSMLGHHVSLRVVAHHSPWAPAVNVTTPIAITPGAAPRATVAPRITGKVRVGRAITVSHGTWSPSPSSYRYAWYADGKLLRTTLAKLKLTSALAGKTVKAVVTALLAGHANGSYACKPVKVPRH